MFILSNALKNIKRYARRSALYALICAVAALTLQIYMSGIVKTEAQLDRLAATIPVSALVTSLDGMRTDGLQIRAVTVDGLQNSEHVRDLQITVFLWATGNLPRAIHVLGANTVSALELPDEIEWLPGFGSECLAGDEAVIVLDTVLMSAIGARLGDALSLSVSRPQFSDRGDITYDQLGSTSFRVTGRTDLLSSRSASDAVIPFETARGLFDRAGAEFAASSASFNVRDAARINEFKAEMKTLRLSVVALSGDVSMAVMANKSMALMVDDAAFISSATQLRELLSLMQGFLPLLAAALTAIGYFISYLMIQTRREEYAVFRLLGLGKRGGMGMYFAEMAVLTLGGSLLGVVMSVAIGVGGVPAGVWVFALFSLCFLLGSVIALLRLGRVNVIQTLARTD
jgi:ABC-type lipoprotein release transport system permease subunit